MALIISNKIYLLLLIVFYVTIVHSKNVNKAKMEEISEVFNEIEKNQQKLKKEFEDILVENPPIENKEQEGKSVQDTVLRDGTTEEAECNCVPYHLCYPETGDQITDGKFLLEARLNSDLCENPVEICCRKKSSGQSRMLATQKRDSECGYGYSKNIKQDFQLIDDPSVSKFGQFPWTVVINKNNAYACVGSLIHPKVVLTIAHCVNTSDSFSVRAGDWNVKSKLEPLPHQNRKAIEIINHPEFRLDNLIYDVALLVVDKEFELQENINTVCLTQSAPNPLITSPNKCVATGWGVDKPYGRYNQFMKYIKFSVTNHQTCQELFRSTRLGNKFQLHQSFLCAIGHHGSDACQGNGGAPLVCPLSKQPERYQQIGIVSWGINCGEPNMPAVFTKISQIKDWIDSIFDVLGYSKEFYTE